jgi:hypothetical protein
VQERPLEEVISEFFTRSTPTDSNRVEAASR